MIPPMTRPRPWLLILLAAFAYAFAHLGWYAITPLGRVPVLDELDRAVGNAAFAGIQFAIAVAIAEDGAVDRGPEEEGVLLHAR